MQAKVRAMSTTGMPSCMKGSKASAEALCRHPEKRGPPWWYLLSNHSAPRSALGKGRLNGKTLQGLAGLTAAVTAAICSSGCQARPGRVPVRQAGNV